MDIEGTFEFAHDSARKHGVNGTLVKWIYLMVPQRLLCIQAGVNHY